jgi:hypothetical protein
MFFRRLICVLMRVRGVRGAKTHEMVGFVVVILCFMLRRFPKMLGRFLVVLCGLNQMFRCNRRHDFVSSMSSQAVSMCV